MGVLIRQHAARVFFSAKADTTQPEAVVLGAELVVVVGVGWPPKLEYLSLEHPKFDLERRTRTVVLWSSLLYFLKQF